MPHQHLALPRVQSVHPPPTPPPRVPAPVNPQLWQRLPQPENMPFDFEENQGPGQRAIPPAPRRDPSYPPPRPHLLHRNQPQAFPDVPPALRLGLGGAILGGRGHRRQAAAGNRVQEHHTPLVDRLNPVTPPNGRPVGRPYALFRHLLPMADLFQHYWDDVVGDDEGVNPQVRAETPDYDPEWTHPGKPEYGFSYSFIDESTTIVMDDGSTREEKPSRGVCSHCKRMLVVNGSDEDGRRIYALRCGHMIDARCIQELIGGVADLPAIDKKGKGKARADYYEPDGDESQSQNAGHYALRSRASAQSSAAQQPVTLKGRKPAKGGRRGKKKSGPQIADQRYFKCPVEGCGRAHVAVQMDESPEWVQDKERGALPVFV